MGASGWEYFVPYEADISSALQRLRQDLFARGDYASGDGLTHEERLATIERLRPELDPWMEKVKEAAAKLEEPFRTKYIETFSKVKSDLLNYSSTPPKPKPKPKTIEKLLEQQAESGTHSILDIVCISTEPQFGAIRPFPNSKLLEFFDSETPSHSEINEAYESGRLEDFLSERWQGIYIIAYLNGLPNEVFFAGHSGD